MQDYRVLIDTLQAQLPRCTLYLQGLLAPTPDGTLRVPGLNPERIGRVNAQLAALAAQRGCYFLDLSQVLCGSDGTLKAELAAADGIHLTPEGYLAWYDYLKTHAADTSVVRDGLLFPVEASGYQGMSRDFTGAEEHAGIDLRGAVGTPLYAAADGTVTKAVTGTTGYGNYLEIDHGGKFSTLYGQCEKLAVEEGASVVRGQLIASLGSSGNSTGPHLHFEVREGDLPVDPMAYFPSGVTDLSQEALVPDFLWPLPDKDRLVTARFGTGTYRGEQREHTGIDLMAGDSSSTKDSAVIAALAGVVTESGEDTEGGGYLVIDHGGKVETVYAGLDPDRMLVQEGSVVSAGMLIGHIGESGNGAHLHFEVRRDGQPLDPLTELFSEEVESAASSDPSS